MPEKVVIDGHELWHGDCREVLPPPPAPRPDRDRIRRDIKAGKAVPGCHLLATERLEIKC